MREHGEFDPAFVAELARRIRIHAIRMAHQSQSSHVASALSCADVMATLFGAVMRYRGDDPEWAQRDRFVLSKGHAASALYAALAEVGFFDIDLLDTYNGDGSPLLGHATRGTVPGIEASTGSLGHGLPISVGLALAIRDSPGSPSVYCLVSDGECQEGTTWEAALLARQWSLRNLVVIVDNNGLQGLGSVDSIASLTPFAAKWRAFGWAVRELNGHDRSAMHQILTTHQDEAPLCVIAHTIKGRGVDYMEGELEWHYRSPGVMEQEVALKQLGRE